MTHWLIRWLTDGFCEYYAAFLILTAPTDELGASNMDIEL